MSLFGIGDQDWVELDLDDLEASSTDGLVEQLVEQHDVIAGQVGFGYRVESDADGSVYIVEHGQRRFKAQVDRSGRLLFTGILDPEGPL